MYKKQYHPFLPRFKLLLILRIYFHFTFEIIFICYRYLVIKLLIIITFYYAILQKYVPIHFQLQFLIIILIYFNFSYTFLINVMCERVIV